MPLQLPGTAASRPPAVVELIQDYSAIEASVGDLSRTLAAALGIALSVLFLLLLPVLWRASKRLAEQTRAIENSEARFRSLVQNSSNVITIIDRAFRITYQSAAIGRVLGFEPEAHVLRPLCDLVHPDDRPLVLAALAKVVTDARTTVTVEHRCLHADGAYSDCESMITDRLGDDAVGGIVVNTRDITERRAMEGARLQSEAKSRLMAVMNHEVRTPLNAILGFADLLDTELQGPLNEGQRRYVTNIASGGRHLLAPVNDSLDLARIEADQMELVSDELEVGLVLAQAAEQVAPLAEARRLHLETSGAPGLTVLADRRRLLQVLWNSWPMRSRTHPPAVP